jgi:hypothetical protein
MDMVRHRRVICIALLAASFSVRGARAITIDDFSAGAFAIEVLRHESESITLTNLPSNNTLGESRYVTLNGLGPTLQSSVRVSVDTVSSEFRYDADPGASAANFSVVYGKSTNLQANLLSDGANSIVFDFTSATFEPGIGYFDIVVTTQPGGRYLYVPVSNSASPFSLVLPYRAFETGSSGANFGNVSRISFGTGNGNLQGDFALASIRTAYYPEGDFNFDGSVDQFDYSGWRSQFGNIHAAYPVDTADGNRDGKVDAADFLIWRHAVAAPVANSSSSNVPEPATLPLLTTAFLSIMHSMRRSTMSRSQ